MLINFKYKGVSCAEVSVHGDENQSFVRQVCLVEVKKGEKAGVPKIAKRIERRVFPV